MTVAQIIPLVIALPLVGALINGTVGKKLSKNTVGAIATGVMAIAFALALMAFFQVKNGESVRIQLFTMLHTDSFQLNASFLADNLSLWMTLIVTGVGTLIHLFSMGYMKHDEGFYKFFVYLNLFIFAMLTLVLGSNYFLLFFGWEGVGICSYLLIGFWYSDFKNTLAARKAFIMNRIGDLGLLVGLFLILAKFGTLEYGELAERFELAKIATNDWMIFGITMCLFIGATGKSAQIPLFTWLPDAMAGPTPVSALIHAATMVTAGIFLTVRSNYLFEAAPMTKDVMLYIGLATSIVAAFIAMRQNDIKKVLAYSTVSQLGMLFVSLGMGAYTAAMFHVTTHAFFKALLFLGSGSVIHAMSDDQDIRNMGGLRKKIPVTHLTFLIGTLAIAGFPLLSGFYSKDEIIAHAFSHGQWLYFALMASAALTAIYMFRLYFVTFHGSFRGTHEQEHHVHEGPKSMTIPLIILAIASVFGGLLNLPGIWLHDQAHFMDKLFCTNVLGMNHLHEAKENPNLALILMVAAAAMSLIILVITYVVYGKKNSVPVSDENVKGWEKLSMNKLYFDEIYNFLFVRPVTWMSEKGSKYFEGAFLHRGVVGIGEVIGKSGNLVRKWQTGRTDSYILWMVFGLVGIVLYVLFYISK
jgi:NADH-quinone oxidoreductase subunit L